MSKKIHGLVERGEAAIETFLHLQQALTFRSNTLQASSSQSSAGGPCDEAPRLIRALISLNEAEPS